jgi:hypothetical protein
MLCVAVDNPYFCLRVSLYTRRAMIGEALWCGGPWRHLVVGHV